MPSQLYTNDAIDFICARDFIYNGKDYKRGHKFDQENPRLTNGQLENLVRTRYVIPVVDSLEDKPRHWYRHVKLRKDVVNKLRRTGSLTLTEDTTPSHVESGIAEEDVEQNEYPKLNPISSTEIQARMEGREVKDEDREFSTDYRPEVFTAATVEAYAKEHPELAKAIADKERKGKNRTTLIKKLDKIHAPEVEETEDVEETPEMEKTEPAHVGVNETGEVDPNADTEEDDSQEEPWSQRSE